MNPSNINWLTIAVILVFLYYMRRGWKLGFIRTVFGIMTFFIALAAGTGGGPYVAAWLMTSDIANGFSMLTIQIFSFVIVFLLLWVILWFICDLLDIISKLPIVHGINKWAGVLIGAFHGLFVLWFCCIVLMLFKDSETGSLLFSYIDKSPFLSSIYDNNLLSQIIWKGDLK